MTSDLAVRFLVSLGRTLSSRRLYQADHPATEEAESSAFEQLRELTEGSGPIVFSFLDGEAAWEGHRLRTMADWPWSGAFEASGVERLEFEPGVSRNEFAEFCESLAEIVDGDASAEEPSALPHARWGRLSRSEEDEEDLREKLEADLEDLEELFELASDEGIVSPELSNAVVDSIFSAIRRSRNLLRLLVPLKEHDQYTTVHSMNVSVLSIGLAELTGYVGRDVREVGEAALLHDVGKSIVPETILQKPSSLTEDEWAEVRRHPEEGARILLRSSGDLEVASVVAYEHHWRWDGGGYPERRYPREPHPATQLVQICDVFDALRTRRPFRPSWDADRIQEHLKASSGGLFSPEAVDRFLSLLESG